MGLKVQDREGLTGDSEHGRLDCFVLFFREVEDILRQFTVNPASEFLSIVE